MRMLSKEDILAILRSKKPYLEKNMGVKRIGLFGSYAKDLQTAESDVDIYIEIEDNEDYKKILSVLLFLEQKLGKRVDLVCKGNNIRSSFLHTLETETVYA